MMGIPYVKMIAAAAIAVAAFLAGMSFHKLIADRKIAKIQADWAENVRAATEATAAAEREQRHIEQERRHAADKAKEGLDHERSRIALLQAALDASRRPPADVGRLRDELATARLAGQAGRDSAAACADRAATYEQALARGSQLLAEGADLAGRAAGAHDERAAEVQALSAAWPR